MFFDLGSGSQGIVHIIGPESGLTQPGNDIDTDQIIPARFMTSITFDGLGKYAFYDLRYAADGTQKVHSFNEQRYKGTSILMVNRNSAAVPRGSTRRRP